MSQRHGPYRISSAVEDRNRGQGLPSSVGDESYRKLAEVLNRRRAARVAPQRRTAARQVPAPAPKAQLELRRFASLEEVQSSGFKRVAQGLYREAHLGKHAHPIWELRGAEDGEGFVLVRKKEERAVDLRQAAGAGTAAAVEAGIMARTARTVKTIGTGSRRRAAEKFMVSLLQTPGGDIKQRKTVMPEQPMDVEDLQRLADELKLGPISHNFDTWSDGEWELRIRGPGGQLIHDYESVGPDEIGGERGRGLLDVINGVLPVEEGDDLGGDLGAPMEGEVPMPGEESEGGLLGGDEVTEPGAEPPPEALPPPPPPGAPGEEAPPGAPPVVPPAGALAPSAAKLKRGRRIAVIKNGQVADAIVVMVRPQQQALDVVMEKAMGGAGGGAGGALGGGPFGDAGMMGGMVETVPMLDVVDMGEDGDEAEIEIESDEADPFEVEIQPASEEAAYEDGQGGDVAETPAPFGPGGEGGPDLGEGGAEPDTLDDSPQDIGGGDDGGGQAPFGSDSEAFDDAFFG